MAFLKKIQLQQIILFMNEIMGIYNINKKYTNNPYEEVQLYNPKSRWDESRIKTI